MIGASKRDANCPLGVHHNRNRPNWLRTSCHPARGVRLVLGTVRQVPFIVQHEAQHIRVSVAQKNVPTLTHIAHGDIQEITRAGFKDRARELGEPGVRNAVLDLVSTQDQSRDPRRRYRVGTGAFGLPAFQRGEESLGRTPPLQHDHRGRTTAPVHETRRSARIEVDAFGPRSTDRTVHCVLRTSGVIVLATLRWIA